MSQAVLPGQGLEGEAIDGQSRKPLRTRGREMVNGIRVFVHIAEFDVKSEIVKALPSGLGLIWPMAYRGVGDDLVCAKATIYTTQKKRPRDNVSKGSATHKTNHWQFTRQTAVVIEKGHDEIVAAIERRQIEEDSSSE